MHKSKGCANAVATSPAFACACAYACTSVPVHVYAKLKATIVAMLDLQHSQLGSIETLNSDQDGQK